MEGVLLDGRSPIRRLDVTREEDALVVAGLPQGTVELTLTLCSPDAPAAKKGQEACTPAEGMKVQPVRWTVRIPAVLGKVSETSVGWPWPGEASR